MFEQVLEHFFGLSPRELVKYYDDSREETQARKGNESKIYHSLTQCARKNDARTLTAWENNCMAKIDISLK